MPPKESKIELIPAVGYLRKSTKGERADGSERQEKSLPQQKLEITKLADKHFEIVGWYDDPGVSGTKMARVGFQRMLERARERGDFQAVLCDNLDRFARADIDLVPKQANAEGVRSDFFATKLGDTLTGRGHGARRKVFGCVVFHVGLGCTQCG